MRFLYITYAEVNICGYTFLALYAISVVIGQSQVSEGLARVKVNVLATPRGFSKATAIWKFNQDFYCKNYVMHFILIKLIIGRFSR